MTQLIHRIVNVDTLEIGGSLLTPAEIDEYSDVDMVIFLRDNTPIKIEEVLDAIADEFAPVFGYEIISHSRKDAIRLCLENGMRFDLIFRYPREKESANVAETFPQKVDRVVNQFWFFASYALARFARKDNLVAAHLALEMYQSILVVQMLARDEAKGTKIHRFGENEKVFLPLNSEPLATLSAAVGEMDSLLARLALGYPAKLEIFRTMTQKEKP